MELERQDIIGKVKRLLRLTRSDNVLEAANAARHAQRMMSKYQLELAELGDTDEDSGAPHMEVRMGEEGIYEARALQYWICRLAACLADLNHCETFIRTEGGNQSIGLVGSPRDVGYVRYMFGYLRREIVRLCRIYASATAQMRGVKNVGTKWRTDFKLGATDEVILRMQEAKEDAFLDASPQALMKINAVRKAAKSWVEENVTLPGRKRKKSNLDQSGYQTGRLAGHDIELQSSGVALPEGTEK